ncbi:MAG: cupin domain-containing protein [Ignavibacteriales bacterium]|nr:cupin domain-containing protein [Ignavibacteriales bacterium]
MIISKQNISTISVCRFQTFFISLCILISSNTLAQESNDSSDQKKHWTIDECVNEFNFEDTLGTSVGYQYWFFNKDFIDGRTLKMSVVAPHSATHTPHTHSEDEFFFVLEGTAEFYLDGKMTVGKQYSAFYCPRNIEHGIKNVGDTELKYLVIKKYENIN